MSNKKHVIHAALGAVSLLVIGVVIGVHMDRTLFRAAAAVTDAHSQASALDANHENFLQGLRSDLGLSETQASQIHEILSRHQAAVDESWSIVHARLESAIDSVTSEIEAILDSNQRVELHEWLMERHGLSDSHGADEGR
jgi:hypothetical protein